jgi:hypothetical protein
MSCSSLKFVFAAGLFGLLSACSTTQVKSVWKDPAYFGKPQKVMVVAVSKEAITRRMVEDEFVLQLKAHGVEGIASYAVLPDKKQHDQEAISKMVEQLGADAVLISRLVSKRNVRVYYPATVNHRPHRYAKWPHYYHDGYEMVNTPGYSTRYEYALMEINLYDASNDSLLWAATTETGMSNFNQTLVKPYIGSILKLMGDSGLLRQ